MAIGTVLGSAGSEDTPIPAFGGGILNVHWSTYNIAAAPADNDIIKFLWVPAGATVVGGFVFGDDIDTGTEALDFDIGWAANGDEAADPDGFGNLGVVTGDVSTHLAVASIWIPFQGVLFSAGPKTFARKTCLQVEFNAAANAGGTGRLSMAVHYRMP